MREITFTYRRFDTEKWLRETEPMFAEMKAALQRIEQLKIPGFTNLVSDDTSNRDTPTTETS